MAKRLFSVLMILLCFAVPVVGQEVVIADFESPSLVGWQMEGDAFGRRPVAGALQGQMPVSGYLGGGLVNSFHEGDRSRGAMVSPAFTITNDFVSFLIGGGELPGEVGIELLVDGERVHIATGHDSEELRWTSWDVRHLRGQSARVRIFDDAVGGWGHVLVDHILISDSPRQSVELGRLESYRRSPEYYNERYRPRYHFTPEVNWMNDPNGLVYFDGEYHMFYQFNPHGIEWGHMSWGHAVSGDLVRWQHLPIALHEEFGVMAFSGSAVVDQENSSGFGVGDDSPLVAIYTGHGHGVQTQDLAYSLDRGRHWDKYLGNPVLDIGEADFRDPKVFWHEPTGRWVMVVAMATEKRIRFYGSADLKTWKFLSEFGPAGVETKTNWECPDLFELPIVGEPGQSRWVLEVDMGGGAVAGGSGGEYFIGVFDGERFVPDSSDAQWVDYGRDFYAPVSWSDIPEADGRRIWIGWMNNWETCLNPTYPWRSAMSVPRELTLRRIGGRLRLCQRPVRELESYRGERVGRHDLELSDESMTLGQLGQQLEIMVEFRNETASAFGVRVLKGTGQQTTVVYDDKTRTLSVDRTESGNTSFHPAFPGVHGGPLEPSEGGVVRMRILVDSSSVEVFGNDGETVITDLVFPDEASGGVEIFATGGKCRVLSLEAYPLRSATPGIHPPDE